LQLADDELDRIAQITKNTLGFYRDSASPTKVNVSESLREVLALYSRRIEFKQISLICDAGNELEIVAFPGEVRQIFANLIANAIDALPEAGALRIRASNACRHADIAERGVRITFLDNGTGISPPDRQKIFKPFYTTKKDTGTGLGLWLVHGLVEKHHGSLQVRSGTNPGNTWTAFSVFLPERTLTN
jgi:signal transduction histidine kinase